jgi:spermidine/putrescine transport system permease protein
MTAILRRYGLTLTVLMVTLTLVWTLLLIVLPYFVMVDFSLRPNLLPADIGGPKDVYTLSNYTALFGNALHLKVFLKTIWSGILVVILCLAVCYPIAYYLAQGTTPERVAFLMLMLVIPFWVNEILRSFAWFIILSYSGPLNWLATTLGIVGKPVRFMSGDAGVMIGMVYAFLLFMVFPLYNAIESLDRSQIEAARDLGAPRWRIHWRIVLPHAKPGIAVGCIMVFVLAVSSYAVPAILGSTSSFWFTQIIFQFFFEGMDWARGSAYAFALLIACLIFIAIMMRLFRVTLLDVAK